MRYEFFEHSADAKFRAYGKSMTDCFKNAALAMFSIMIEKKKVNSKINKKIKVEGEDLKSLLYNFLDKLIYLLDVDKFVLKDVKSLKINGSSLEATLIGEKISRKHEFGCEVKAATYNQMRIRNKKPFMVQVVVDL